MDTWAFGRGGTTVSEVLATLQDWLPLCDGITISGGEPFDQVEALLDLLQNLRNQFNHDILVYTGYDYEHIAPLVKPFTNYIDALITGRYEAALPATLPLRGSDNQQLHLLSPLGKAAFSNVNIATLPQKSLDLMFDPDGTVWLAGIPPRGDLQKLTALLGEQGIITNTSERGVGR